MCHSFLVGNAWYCWVPRIFQFFPKVKKLSNEFDSKSRFSNLFKKLKVTRTWRILRDFCTTSLFAQMVTTFSKASCSDQNKLEYHYFLKHFKKQILNTWYYWENIMPTPFSLPNSYKSINLIRIRYSNWYNLNKNHQI